VPVSSDRPALTQGSPLVSQVRLGLGRVAGATHPPKHQSLRFFSAVWLFCTSGGNLVLSDYPYSL
jgi:hypothetical protein